MSSNKAIRNLIIFSLVSIIFFTIIPQLVNSKLADDGGCNGCSSDSDCSNSCPACQTPHCSGACHGVCSCVVNTGANGAVCGSSSVACNIYCSGNSACHYAYNPASCTEYCSSGSCIACTPSCGSPTCTDCGACGTCSGGTCTTVGCTACANSISISGGLVSATCGISCSGTCTGSCPNDCTAGSTSCNGVIQTVCTGSSFTSTAYSSHNGCTCSQASTTATCYSYVNSGCVVGKCGAVCSTGQVQSCTVNGLPGTQTCQSNCQWGTCSTTCGSQGQSCCSGNTCVSGLTCQVGICQPPPTGSLCGSPCPNGVYDENGNCYTGGGTSCSLNGAIPPIDDPYYSRIWAGSQTSPRSLGVYKSGNIKTCTVSSCTTSSSSITISGSFSSVIYPSGLAGDNSKAYKVGDTFNITISGISAISSWTPLVECRLDMFNSTGYIAKGILFNSWGTGTVIFNYTIQPNDPSGTWSVNYCGLWTDFVNNGGWNLQYNDNSPPYGSTFLVSTGLIVT